MRSSVFSSEKGRAGLESLKPSGEDDVSDSGAGLGFGFPLGAPSVSPSGRCEESGHSCLEQGRDQRMGWNEGQP